jgi:hypothetical protein
MSTSTRRPHRAAVLVKHINPLAVSEQNLSKTSPPSDAADSDLAQARADASSPVRESAASNPKGVDLRRMVAVDALIIEVVVEALFSLLPIAPTMSAVRTKADVILRCQDVGF